ncbi:MAG TPA: Maf family protein [Rhizomicrobium sp.]|nr:Maf family protein [Rhizomicrobium sp.]
MTLILASASSPRARILRGARVPFVAIPADIDESALKAKFLAEGKAVEEVALALAEAKAVHVSKSHRSDLVLGADQVLEFADELLNKCSDLTEARQLLLRLRGRRHRLISALALAEAGHVIWTHSEGASLKMREFSSAFLEAYLAHEGDEVLSGVGCYRLEAMGAQLFEHVEGDYFSILGLPLQPLLAELRRKGVIAS